MKIPEVAVTKHVFPMLLILIGFRLLVSYRYITGSYCFVLSGNMDIVFIGDSIVILFYYDIIICVKFLDIVWLMFVNIEIAGIPLSWIDPEGCVSLFSIVLVR